MDSRFFVLVLGVLFVGGCGTSTIVLGGSPAPGGSGDSAADAGASAPFPGGPSPWSLSAKVTRDDVEPSDGLGAAVAATTDVVFASSQARDDSGAPTSAVYVFERRGVHRWRRTQRLFFGSARVDALALDGNQALLATSTTDPDLGTITAANVVVAQHGQDRWSITGQLPSLAAAQHTSVFLGGGRAMVVDASGAVSILSNSAGQWTSEYTTQIAQGKDYHPQAAFSGDRALVTSEAYDASTNTLAWSGHILERGQGGWSEVAVIEPTGLAHDPDPPDFRTASLAGDWAVFAHSSTQTHPAAVHLYHRGTDGTWAFAKDLDVGTTDGMPNCSLGCRVALDGQHLILEQVVTGILVYSLQNGDWVKVGTASDGAQNQTPGVALALGGDVIAVGDAQDSLAATWGGAIRMYSGLSQDQCNMENDVLTANDELDQTGSILLPDRGRLGVAVDTNGSTAVVTDQGATIVYDNVNGTWTEQALLTPPDESYSSDGFNLNLGRGILAGTSVAISGIAPTSTGNAYVFDRGSDGTFSKATPLVPAGLPEWQMVGYMLAGVDGLVAVGSIHASYSVPGNPDTFATVFERGTSGWRQAALLETPDNIDQCGATPTLAVASDRILVTGTCATVVDDYARAPDGSWQKQPSFGPASHKLTSITATAMAGGLAAVGGYDDTNDYATYIFSRASGAWTETARIDDADAIGPVTSLSLTADTLAVGYTDFYPNSVRLYRLRDGAWSQDQAFAAQDAPTNPSFGNSVALGGSFLLVGSPGDGVAAAVAGGGAFYVFGVGPVAFR